MNSITTEQNFLNETKSLETGVKGQTQDVGVFDSSLSWSSGRIDDEKSENSKLWCLGVLLLIHGLAFVFSFLFAHTALSQTSEVSGSIQRSADATHFEFSGKSSWDYDLKKKQNKVVLRIPALNQELRKKIETWSGPLIKETKVNPAGADGQYEVTFHLKNTQAQTFDYLTEEPSRLMIDFYLPKRKAKKEQVKKIIKPNVEVVSKEQKEKKKVKKETKRERKPAGVDFIVVKNKDEKEKLEKKEGQIRKAEKSFNHGIFDGADPKIDRFRIKKEDIRANYLETRKRNIYLRFPILDLKLPYLRKLWKNPPIYEVRDKKTQESKVVQLLIKLHKENKLATFVKTSKFFREQYSKSKYMEMVDYMDADLAYQRWKSSGSLVEFENAMIKYRENIERYPNSALTERTFLLMGYSYLERNDAMGTLKILQRFLSKKPKTKFRDKAELAIAEAFLRLNRFKESVGIYKKVARSGRYKKNQIEAQYLIGDAYYKKGQFKRAIAFFEKALEMYPEQWKKFPNAKFHLAESHFWTTDYMESMDRFIDFLQKFPDHRFGGYAMTRLGELLEIFGAPKSQITGAFLEGYFRYRDTQGGGLARARILAAKMPEMEDKELGATLKEFSEIIKRSKLAKTDQFVTVQIADGYFNRKEYSNATEELLRFYQQNPTKTNLPIFKDRIVRNITAKVRGHVKDKKFLHALKERSRFLSSWLKGNDRLDLGFYIGNAFEQAGVLSEASKEYRETLNRLYSLKKTKQLEKRSYFEDIPSEDSLNLRLASVASKEKNYPKANSYLKQVRKPDQMSDVEQIELVELAAQIAEERGRLSTAKNFLIKASENWKGQPAMVLGPYFKLAHLQFKTKDYQDSLTSIQKIENLAEDSNLNQNEYLLKALQLKAEIQIKKKRKMEAVTTYKKIFEKFPNRSDLGVARYRAGKILFDMGKVGEAKEIWKNLEKTTGQSKSLWSKLADEQTKDAQWNDRYKKYLSRIPAMEGFNE